LKVYSVIQYTKGCGHCKNAKPHFVTSAEHFKEDPKVAFVGVDCTKHNSVCEQYGVKGFPTIFYFKYGKNPQPYEGGREAKDFIRFMSNPEDPNSSKPVLGEDWQEIQGHQHVNILGDSNFDEFIQSKKKVLVMFYAPWCGHCKNMKPAYGQAATELTSFVPGSYLAAVDATLSSKLSQRFDLKGFPTLKYFEDGQFKFDYQGGRNKEDFVEFMRNPKIKTEL
jgi:protein disulfide-isomerase-like protein